MNRKLRFGVATAQNVPWEKMVERWRFIEELGFDSVWVADHFAFFTRPSMPWFEAWTLLAGLATQTTRIRFGTLVTAIPFRNPAFLARQALTVDHLSHGRLEIGLGTGVRGENDPSYAMTGIEDWAPPERVGRFREAVEIVDQLLRNEVSTYQGRYYQLKDAVMQPRPVQDPRPPITIGAAGRSMLKLVARYADTWSAAHWGPGRSPDERLDTWRERNMLLDDFCAEIGRDPMTLGRSLMRAPQGLETAYDSVDAFEDDVGRYVAEGIDEFIFPYPLRDDQLPVFERIAIDAIPNLRC